MKNKEGILVECQPPAGRQSALHSEQVLELNKFEHVRGRGSLHGEVTNAIMGNGHMGSPPWTDRQTRLETLPSRNFVGGR